MDQPKEAITTMLKHDFHILKYGYRTNFCIQFLFREKSWHYFGIVTMSFFYYTKTSDRIDILKRIKRKTIQDERFFVRGNNSNIDKKDLS